MEVKKKYVYLISCICVVLCIGALVFFTQRKKDVAQPAVISLEQEVTVTKPFFAPQQLANGNKFYLNRLLKFSVVYPGNLDVQEYGQGNTSTIVFEDVSTQEGFQVFVVPYEEQVVSDERFKMDVPSGVMKDPVDILVDGVRATMFFSHNSLLGETREVWFIKDGFLYEVTARKDLDGWLSEIIRNWKFI